MKLTDIAVSFSLIGCLSTNLLWLNNEYFAMNLSQQSVPLAPVVLTGYVKFLLN